MARGEFSRTSVPTVAQKKDHSHPVSAANRSAARLLIEVFSKGLGLSPYYIQASPAEQSKGKSSRDYYWSKDVSAAPVICHKDPADVYVLVDVDYYIDMPKWLLKHPNITCLYTLVPESVSYVSDDYSYTFDQDSQLVMTVSGGARYQHPLWSYGMDILDVVSDSWWDYLTFGVTAMTYNVESRKIA
jgi:hypothetical protein